MLFLIPIFTNEESESHMSQVSFPKSLGQQQMTGWEGSPILPLLRKDGSTCEN